MQIIGFYCSKPKKYKKSQVKEIQIDVLIVDVWFLVVLQDVIIARTPKDTN